MKCTELLRAIRPSFQYPVHHYTRHASQRSVRILHPLSHACMIKAYTTLMSSQAIFYSRTKDRYCCPTLASRSM